MRWFQRHPEQRNPEISKGLRKLVKELSIRQRDFSYLLKKINDKDRRLPAKNLLDSQSLKPPALALLQHSTKRFLKELYDYSYNINNIQYARIFALYSDFYVKIHSEEVTVEAIEAEMTYLINGVRKVIQDIL